MEGDEIQKAIIEQEHDLEEQDTQVNPSDPVDGSHINLSNEKGIMEPIPEEGDLDEAKDTDPLLPAEPEERVQERGHGRHPRRRRSVRMRYFALALTIIFIFISIALTALYFILPVMIRKGIEGGQRNKGSSLLRADPVRLHSLREDSFQIDMKLQINLEKPSKWGYLIGLRYGELIWKNASVSSFTTDNRMHVERGSKALNDEIFTISVKITNPEIFGNFLNTLLLEDKVNVNVRAELSIRPDYFVQLPVTRIAMSMPIDGAPTLLENSTNNVHFDRFDIVSGNSNGLFLRGPQSSAPLVPFGFSVLSGRNKIADVYSAGNEERGNSYIEARVPKYNDGTRSILDGTLTHVRLIGRPDLTAAPFKDMVRMIDANIALPVVSDPFSVVQEIYITSLLGGTSTRCRNPFSVDIFLDRIEHMDIYRHGSKAKLGFIEDISVNQKIPAKSGDFEIKVPPSGRIKFTGGIQGAASMLRDIKRHGYIKVDLRGRVGVRVDEFKVKDLPVRLKGIKISMRNVRNGF